MRRAALASAATLAGLLLVTPASLRADEDGGGLLDGFWALWERDEVVATGKVAVTAEIGHGAGAARAARMGKITAGGFNRRLGNKAARSGLARAGKQVAANVKAVEEALHVPLVSTAVSVTDTASSVAGRVYEGDLVGAGAELVKEGGKQLSTAAGAAAGAKVLAMVAAPFGPVAAGAAAIVGAAGGAAVTAVGYDAYLSEWVGNAVEADRKTKEDYVEDAREARRTLPERQARERAEAQWREEWKAVEASSGHAEWGGGQVALLPERVMSAPIVAPRPADPPTAPDASRPVLFDDCTIDVTVLYTDYPDLRVKLAFDVRGDTVTGRGEGSNPGRRTDSGFITDQRWTARIEGTLRDNVITTVNRTKMHTARSEHSWEATLSNGGHARRTCVYEWDGEAESRETWTFLMGGEGRLQVSGRSTTHGRASMDCDGSMNHTTHVDFTDEGKMRFTWKVRR